jgi:hypothetical protein
VKCFLHFVQYLVKDVLTRVDRVAIFYKLPEQRLTH